MEYVEASGLLVIACSVLGMLSSSVWDEIIRALNMMVIVRLE